MPKLNKLITCCALVGAPTSLGANAPSINYPDFGAVLPTPFVDCIPGGKLLA